MKHHVGDLVSVKYRGGGGRVANVRILSIEGNAAMVVPDGLPEVYATKEPLACLRAPVDRTKDKKPKEMA